jgi:protein-disulfide isomerase
MKRWIPLLQITGSLCLLTLGFFLVFDRQGTFFRPTPVLSVSEQRRLLEGGGHARGPDDAKVTVVGFFDLESEESRSAFRSLLQNQQEHDARLRLIFRHLPITSVHRHAMSAARAVEAASAQEKFWEYVRLVFDQQSVWGVTADNRELFIRYAELIGIEDLQKFRRDVRESDSRDRVLRDATLAQRVGASRPPAFFVNGRRTDTDGLSLAVEKVLSKPE